MDLLVVSDYFFTSFHRQRRVYLGSLYLETKLKQILKSKKLTYTSTTPIKKNTAELIQSTWLTVSIYPASAITRYDMFIQLFIKILCFARSIQLINSARVWEYKIQLHTYWRTRPNIVFDRSSGAIRIDAWSPDMDDINVCMPHILILLCC